jgi:hypothetical protein
VSLFVFFDVFAMIIDPQAIDTLCILVFLLKMSSMLEILLDFSSKRIMLRA